jgi:hypothetical protein
MAIIRGAFGGAQIRNSIASVTFSQGPFGTIARARTPPVNPNSPRQNSIRTSMSLVSNAWTAVLTDAERTAWKNYADGTPLPDPFGGTKIVSGRQMFIRTNLVFADALGTIQPAAPTTPGVGRAAVLTLAADTIAGLEIDSVTPTIDAGSLVLIGISPPLNSARNYFRSPYTQAVALDSVDTFPFVVKGPTLVAVGQKYFVSARRIETDGKVGEKSQYSVVVV